MMVAWWNTRGSCKARRLCRLAPGLAAIAALSGCVVPPLPVGLPSLSARPPMRWDHRPEAAEWTAAALAAVTAEDAVLASQVPEDIETWCPGYADASMAERRAFWAGLLSALAKHESGWNPRAAGGGGRWIGLMQISPKSARGHGCSAQSAKALKDGAANLTCAVTMMAGDVARDRVVAGKGNRGVGRQWMPFRKSGKRQEMAAWTSAQPYCSR